MTEKQKLIKVHELFREMQKLLPENSVNMSMHNIKEKDIPADRFKYNNTQQPEGVKVYRDKNRKNTVWGIDVFVDREDTIE